MPRNRISTILYHTVVWLVYHGFISLALFLSGSFSTGKDVFFNYLASTPFVLAFYLSLFVVFRNLEKKKWLIAGIGLPLIFVLVYCIDWFLYSEWIPGQRRGFPFFSRVIIADVVVNFLQHFLYAFLFWQFSRRVKTEKQLHAAETEKLKTEYNFLKSQINPHFLYNTLDYFYAAALKQDKQQAEGLAVLSQLMRYSLTDGNENGKVTVAAEAEQVENYILLQQLRFGNQLHIRFDNEAETSRRLILPHLFITLVENSFKYGVTTDAAYPVRIHLTENENEIRFSVWNRVSTEKKDQGGTGVGLNNLKKRLQLEYPLRHRYVASHADGCYEATLILINETT